MFLYQIQI